MRSSSKRYVSVIAATLMLSVCFFTACENNATPCEHEYSLVTTKPSTCIEKGLEIYACKYCEKINTRELSEFGAHVWDDGEVEEAATTDKEGTMLYHCTTQGCSEEKRVPIQKLDAPVSTSCVHQYEEIATLPSTCVKHGTKYSVCTLCEKVKAESISELGEHCWDDGVIETQPTLEAEGSMLYHCLNDGCVETRSLPIPEASVECVYGNDVTVFTLNDEVSEFWGLDFNVNNIETYCNESNHYAPKDVTLIWKSGASYTGNYIFELAYDEGFEKIVTTITTSRTTVTLKDLYNSTVYYWRVTYADYPNNSKVYTFVTEEGPRFVQIEGVNNTRDLGGYMTKYGKRIKQGIVYRGSCLEQNDAVRTSGLTEAGREYMLDTLGIRSEIELRTNAEATKVLPVDPNANRKVLNGAPMSNLITYYQGQGKTISSNFAISSDRLYSWSGGFYAYSFSGIGRAADSTDPMSEAVFRIKTTANMPYLVVGVYSASASLTYEKSFSNRVVPTFAHFSFWDAAGNELSAGTTMQVGQEYEIHFDLAGICADESKPIDSIFIRSNPSATDAIGIYILDAYIHDPTGGDNSGKVIDEENYYLFDAPYYGSRIILPEFKDALKGELLVFTNADKYPVYFHCSYGRDRTGTLAFLLLGLCGVNEETLIKEYQLTGFSDFKYDTSRNSYISGITQSALIDGTVTFLKNRYETTDINVAIEQFVLQVLGLTGDEVAAIRTAMIEDFVS